MTFPPSAPPGLPVFGALRTVTGGSCHKYYFVATNTSLVSTKHVFCRDKSILLTTKVLSRQNVCHDKYLSKQKLCTYHFCCDKSCIATNMWCRDKYLSQQKFCRDKIMFVATKDVFCRDKHMFVVCRDRNGTCGSSRQ